MENKALIFSVQTTKAHRIVFDHVTRARGLGILSNVRILVPSVREKKIVLHCQKT